MHSFARVIAPVFLFQYIFIQSTFKTIYGCGLDYFSWEVIPCIHYSMAEKFPPLDSISSLFKDL